MKGNLIGHNLYRNCSLKTLLKNRYKGQEAKRKKTSAAAGCLKEKGRYWKLKVEAPYHTVYRIHFGGGYGPAARQILT